MPEGIPYADIIILALIAGFVLLRLRSILGQNPDNEGPILFKREILKPQNQPEQPIVQPKRPEADTYLAALTDAALTETLNAIKARDAQFTATRFLGGAKMAFEMVFDAFAKGDKPTLQMLLSPSIYDDFAAEIDQRATQENKSETTLVSVQAKDITHAAFEKNMARLTVHFASEQVALVRNPKGEIVEGNASEVHHIENDWTFERDVSSKNPNWKIIET